MVRSPNDESADDGECESDGVGGLSLDETEEVIPGETESHATFGMLGAGISGLASLGDTPLAQPTELEDDGVVPIQDLLYRGRAALRRAAQLGQSFRTSGSTPNADELAELYDLLELAEAD